MTPYLVHHLLEHEAARSPTRELLVTHEPESQRWSYRDADRAANRVAHALVAAGVTAGDRVAVLAPTGRGSSPAGSTASRPAPSWCRFNSAIDPTSLAAQLTDCGARVLYLGARVERTVVAAGARLPAGLTVLVAPGAEAAARALAAARRR